MTKILQLPFILAALSGAIMAGQGTLNSQLSQKTSILSSTLAVHVIGTIGVAIAVFFIKEPMLSYQWRQIPWYLYLGGILGILIVVLVSVSISKVGVCNATTAIIIGQVCTAVIIDHLGLFGTNKIPWNPWQIAGLTFFVVGAKLLFR
jgi:transporter family-2 protein